MLAEQCYSCHSEGAKKLKASLYLDRREGFLTGGDTGPAIVPGKPEQSLLIEAIHHTNVDLQMPPKDRLDASVVADFEQWISWGAPWPEGDAKSKTARADRGNGFNLTKRKAEHWAWQPVTDPPVPEVTSNDWSQDPIDRFVLEKLREQDLRPGPPADKRSLIRRLSFDLTGLPPTIEEVEAFVSDHSEQAYGEVVDRLLSSPRFGERWARHWLDLVRYAETRGHEFDHNVPNAFRYRDYVIRAFNADLPYNTFVTEHLAGDLLLEPRLNPEEKFNESVIGTGFWFLGESIHSPVDIKQDEADRFDNMVDVASKSFLSLTVACARCHDHKFDAISTKDYYAMYGFLQSSNYHQAQIDSDGPNKAIAQELRGLSDAAKRDLANAYATALKPAIDSTIDYIEAAREPTSGELASSLDPTRVKKWNKALANPTDLLQSVSPASAGEWAAAEKSRAEQQLESWKTLSIIADYSTIDESLFIQDGGQGFGLAPVRPGSIRLGDAGVTGVETYGAARRDPVWSNLEIVDSDRDPASRTSQQPGRMLRSPTFVLQAPGKVFYLVKGKGTAMAVVDSHRLVLGPLHGNVHRSLNSQDGLRWEEHGLQRYVGHNLHIEFVPEGDSPLEILAVAQASTENVTLPDVDLFEHPPLASLASSCATAAAPVSAFVTFLQAAFENWRMASTSGSPLAPDDARAVNWIVSNSELFFDDNDTALAEATEIARRFLAKQEALVEQRVQKTRTALAIMDGTPVDDVVYIRGSYKTPGDTVPRRFLEALGGKDVPAPAHGSGRLELARQITDPRNPFVSRSIVNRLWHHLFGLGIVPTTDDFGVLGQRPSHPELLDHLAHSFVADGWSIKRQIRRIVMSKTYRLASTSADPVAENKDPENKWLHRAHVRRLQSESIRDALLAVSGRLDTTPFGRSVPVNLTDFMTGRGRPGNSGPLDGNGRRSIYLEVRRNFLNPMMLAFDTPIPFNAMGRRSVSNVPSQALIMMNDPFVLQQAGVWSARILAIPDLTSAQRIDRMYQEAFARHAMPEEIADAQAFLSDEGSPEAWKDFAHVLFNTKEFIFLN
ncbi:MAG: PSD1 and planctomycete cytochrome C domain-containing protein [Verrucomicrobiales bacterium]